MMSRPSSTWSISFHCALSPLHGRQRGNRRPWELRGHYQRVEGWQMRVSKNSPCLPHNSVSGWWSFSSALFSHSVMSNSLWPHGLPVHHQLSEFIQIHVHWISDGIQPSCPLSISSPSPSTLNLSQHQGLFRWVSSLHQVAKGLEFQLQHQSLQWIFRTDFL